MARDEHGLATITVNKIDTELLAFQRNYLLDLVGSKHLPEIINDDLHGGYFAEELLDGIIELLDAMLDYAEDN